MTHDSHNQSRDPYTRKTRPTTIKRRACNKDSGIHRKLQQFATCQDVSGHLSKAQHATARNATLPYPSTQFYTLYLSTVLNWVPVAAFCLFKTDAPTSELTSNKFHYNSAFLVPWALSLWRAQICPGLNLWFQDCLMSLKQRLAYAKMKYCCAWKWFRIISAVAKQSLIAQ